MTETMGGYPPPPTSNGSGPSRRMIRIGLFLLGGLIALAVAVAVFFTVVVDSPEEVVSGKDDKARAEIKALVDEENEARNSLESELNASIGSLLDELTTALEEGDLDALRPLVTPDLESSIDLTSAAPAWLGVETVTFRVDSISVERVTAPELVPADLPEQGEGDYADAYVPQVVVDGEEIPYDEWKPQSIDPPTSYTVPMEMGSSRTGELSLIRQEDAWVVDGGLLQRYEEPGNAESFAVDQLHAGGMTLAELYEGAEVLPGRYRLRSKGFHQGPVRFPGSNEADLASFVPSVEVSSKVKKTASNHLKKVLDLSIALGEGDPRCRPGADFGTLMVDGVEEVILSGCDPWEDPTKDQLVIWDPAKITVSILHDAGARDATIQVNIAGKGGPVYRINWVSTMSLEPNPKQFTKVDSVDVEIPLRGTGALGKPALARPHGGDTGQR